MGEIISLELDDLVIELMNKLSRFDSLNNFESNVVDPYAAAIESAVFGQKSEDDWRVSELHRQKQKALMNQIGNLQQAIIGRLPGWQSYESGSDMPDVIGERGGQKIIAEVKNKYNTMNSNSAAETYDKLVDFLSQERFNGYVGVVVQLIGPTPRDVHWKPFAPGKSRKERSDLIVMGGRPFYAIATDSLERQPGSGVRAIDSLADWESWRAIDEMTEDLFSAISRCVGSAVPPWVNKFLKPAIGS